MRLARLLEAALGGQGWWPVTPRAGEPPRYHPGRNLRPGARAAFEIAAGAVLTQNTAWTGAARAVTSLRAAGLLSPYALAAAAPSHLAPKIRPAGYFRMKARRLRELARWWRDAGGFERIRHRPTEALRRELLAVSGVGPETADSILNYAFHRPVFVVDAYTRRVFERHGLAEAGEPYDALRRRVEGAFSGTPRRRGRAYRELHAQLVEVGKRWCRPRAPDCGACPLRPLPFASDFVPAGGVSP